MDKDAVIEGEDAEFDRNEGEVVEMTEDVVALAHHHLVIGRDNNDMPSHAVRGACCGVSDARDSDKMGLRAITEATRTLPYEAECRKGNEVVVERDSVSSESFRPKAQRGANGCGDDGHRVDPVDLVDPRIILVRFQIREFCWRKWRRHRSQRRVRESFAGVEPVVAEYGRGLSAMPHFTWLPRRQAVLMQAWRSGSRAVESMRNHSNRASMSRSLVRRGGAYAVRMQRGWRRARLGRPQNRSRTSRPLSLVREGSAIIEFQAAPKAIA
jgi:hypothetical protein